VLLSHPDCLISTIFVRFFFVCNEGRFAAMGCHLTICNLLFAEHTWWPYIVSSQTAHSCFPNSFHRPWSSLYSGGPNIKPWHRVRLSLFNSILVFLRDNTYSKVELVFTKSNMIISLLTKEHFSSCETFMKNDQTLEYFRKWCHIDSTFRRNVVHPFPVQFKKNIIPCIVRKYLF
jgi:hypothetical protein